VSGTPDVGIHHPSISTPPRSPNSIRRTATTTASRPFGLDGPLVLLGVCRDISTDATGTGHVLGQARYEARLDFHGARVVESLSTEPTVDVSTLIGMSAASGFRAMLEEALPAERSARSRLYLLLDDIPVVTLVSGYALSWASAQTPRKAELLLGNIDICSGWRDGGTIIEAIRTSEGVPVVTGPLAPPLTSTDEIAWHSLPALPPHGMRRHRRLDLVPADGRLAIDAFFRDTHMSPQGHETVIHEYTVAGFAVGDELELVELDARPRVLPWLECPLAAESAVRLNGRRAGELRHLVRREFTGISTCTHLNDTLRSLEDIVALARSVGLGASEHPPEFGMLF
jgi:hypothetical protein